MSKLQRSLAAPAPSPLARGPAGWRWLSQLVGSVLLVALLAVAAEAQERAIAGTVVDARTLRPLPGAQVFIPGTGQGVLTDARGQFRIERVVGPQVTLRVTLIGYRTIEEQVAAGQTDLRLALTESAIELDRIVVTGTPGGTQKRAIGNVVSQVDAAAITEVAAIRSVGQLIQGRAPGVVVAPASGTTGAGQRINIRGRSSLSLSSDPLIYIDGIRVENSPLSGPAIQGSRYISRLNDINPDDIESVEIIKGPAAATLYGTEASNGVIHILTKRGRAAERATTNVQIRQGGQWFSNPAGRIPANWGQNEQTGETFSVNLVEREAAAGRPIFRTGHLQGYGVNMSGGSEALRYYLGVDYDRDNGIEPTNQLNRLSARTNLTATPYENLQINSSLGLVTSRVDLAREEGWSTMWATLYGLPSFLDTPRRGFTPAPPEVGWDLYDGIFQTVDRFTGSLQLNHNPLEWFNHRLTVGLDLTGEANQLIIERQPEDYAQFYGPQIVLGSKNVTRRAVSYTTVDYSGTAQANLTPAVRSSTSAGFQFYRTFTEWVNASGTEFPAPGLRTTAALAVRLGSDDYIENTTVGVFVQEQLSWRDRVFLTAAVRADDNSAFGESFDLVYYPKFSATWVVNEEPFWNVPFLNALRLRFAYGQSGLQPEAFAALRTYRPITGPGNTAALTPQFVGNPSLGPERGEEYEAGFDAGFFNGRLGVDFTFYHQITRDAILLRDVAPSSGFPGQQYVNAGSIRNRGVEVLVNALALDTRDADLEFQLNLATNDNKILDLGDLEFIPLLYSRHQVGYPIAAFFRPRIVSAELEADGRVTNVMCDGGPAATAPVPCAQAPDVYIGRPTPRVEGSFTTGLTLFNRLRLHGMANFKLGHHLWDGNTWIRCSLFQVCEENFHPERFDPRWIATVQFAGNSRWIADYITDASHVRLRELSASYTLPERWVSPFGAGRATITVAGRNLFLYAPNYTGLDPESLVTTLTEAPGFHTYLEQANVPQLAQFLTTISVSF